MNIKARTTLWLLVFLTLSFTAERCLAGTVHYVVTNEDIAGPNSATVYKLNTAGALTEVAVLQTGGTGLGGGYFGTTRVAMDDNCIFVSDGGSVIDG